MRRLLLSCLGLASWLAASAWEPSALIMASASPAVSIRGQSTSAPKEGSVRGIRRHKERIEEERIEVFVSSFGNNQVLRHKGAHGSFVDVFVQNTIIGLDGPWSVAFGPADGNLYVSSFATDEVRRYNGKSGEFIDSFVPAGSGGLDQPFTLV